MVAFFIQEGESGAQKMVRVEGPVNVIEFANQILLSVEGHLAGVVIGELSRNRITHIMSTPSVDDPDDPRAMILHNGKDIRHEAVDGPLEVSNLLHVAAGDVGISPEVSVVRITCGSMPIGGRG